MAAPSRLELWTESEWRRCAADPVYFMSEYWKIPIVGKGYSKFALRKYQVHDIEKMKAAAYGDGVRRQLRLKARQIGWTTIGGAFAFWSAYFHDYTDWIIASQGESEAKDTLSTKIKQAYSHLPAWLRKRGPSVEGDTQEEFSFSNGSRIISIPSTSKSGRSKSVFGVLFDEAAFVENADELFAALDPLCYGPMFIFSTANGMGNFFHEQWLEAQAPDSVWESEFHPWSAVPERDDVWYDRTKRTFRGREHLFFQEHPSSPEEAFSKSGNTALPMDLMRAQHWCEPNVRYDLTMLQPHTPPKGAEIPVGDSRDLELHVWQAPYLERGEDGRLWRQPNFVVSVDVSEGLDGGDFSAISVFDVTYGEQVATARCSMPVEDIGMYAEWVAYWYYTALVLVERNSMGLVPLVYLQQAGYPRLYRMDSMATIRRGDRTPRYGFFTNKATKPKMVIDFIHALRQEALVLHDARLLQEAGTFLSDGKGGFGSTYGNNDDEIMATLMGWQGCLDVGQYPVVWRDPTRGPTTMGEMFKVVDAKPQFGRALAGGIGNAQRGAGAVHSVTISG